MVYRYIHGRAIFNVIFDPFYLSIGDFFWPQKFINRMIVGRFCKVVITIERTFYRFFSFNGL